MTPKHSLVLPCGYMSRLTVADQIKALRDDVKEYARSVIRSHLKTDLVEAKIKSLKTDVADLHKAVTQVHFQLWTVIKKLDKSD